jgi:acyl-CoA reductase-like NAD-dependent aldehyde dehydrogenase
MSELTMTIDGQAVATEKTFGVVNPATGEVFAQAPECSAEQLDAAMSSAAKAYVSWRTDEAARREAMVRAADALEAAADRIGAVLTSEQGKPRREANFEPRALAGALRGHATMEIPVDVLQDDDDARVEVIRKPLGVVAAITPWNFPVGLASAKIAPALLVGNTVVLKPSPYTPLSTLLFGEVLRDALPPGVLNVVSGGDQLGAWMTAHPTPRKVTFTGSVATGKKVAASVAPDLKRLTLELGGNDLAILLDDFDLDKIADNLFWSAFGNNGQICMAVKRVYVPEARYDEVVDALADRARSAKVGDGAEDGTQLGPINNAPQYSRVSELVDDAIRGGAKVAAGGKRIDGPGYFFEPTILADITDGTRIVDEEQFGPALPIITYRNLGEVIARANATHFGLSGSVWSEDTERAWNVASQLECGTAWVNTHRSIAPGAPFGGAKWSGLGQIGGEWGIAGMTDPQVVHLAKHQPPKR